MNDWELVFHMTQLGCELHNPAVVINYSFCLTIGSERVIGYGDERLHSRATVSTYKLHCFYHHHHATLFTVSYTKTNIIHVTFLLIRMLSLLNI